MHKVASKVILSVAVALLVSVMMPSSVYAAKSPRPTSTNTGIDVSWPQCGKLLPSGQAFGIVGVNGGLANTTNNCMAIQLRWADSSTGLALSQPKVQLYVNTANPGGLNTASWPTNGVDSAGNIAPNPHGACDGSDTLACAWQYGWNRAVEDVEQRFLPAARTTSLSVNPSDYIWWLDVETENTWKTGSSFAQQSNTADLEGMAAYFSTLGAPVGLYSTSFQWTQITGTVNPSSNLYALRSWLAGSRNLSAAKTNCSLPPLTGGGRVIMNQYIYNGFDQNYSCL